jgi:multidrug resistance efflux pump
MTENEQAQPEQSEAQPAAEQTQDPVRRWTLIMLAFIAVLLVWYLRSDRVTPFTSQARVHALVIPVAAEVSGSVTSVNVGNSQPVESGQTLFTIDAGRYALGVKQAEANLQTAREGQGASAAGVEAARAGVDTAMASMRRAEQDAIRMRNIREQDPGAISQRRLESAEASLAAAPEGRWMLPGPISSRRYRVSVPRAMRTPASNRRRRLSIRLGLISSARQCRPRETAW